jgi:hypothetical protein
VQSDQALPETARKKRRNGSSPFRPGNTPLPKQPLRFFGERLTALRFFDERLTVLRLFGERPTALR